MTRWSPRVRSSAVSVLVALLVLGTLSTVPLSGATGSDDGRAMEPAASARSPHTSAAPKFHRHEPATRASFPARARAAGARPAAGGSGGGGPWSGLPHRHPDTSGVSVVDADLARDRIAPGETVAIGALVENERQSDASFRVDLYVDHQRVDRQFVTAPAGESIVVRFERRFDERGSYAIHANEVPAGTLTVADPTPTPADATPGDDGSTSEAVTFTESLPPEESGLGHLPVLVALVVVLALALYVALGRTGSRD